MMKARNNKIKRYGIHRVLDMEGRPRCVTDASLTACMVSVALALLIFVAALVMMSMERTHRIEQIEERLDTLKQEHVKSLEDIRLMQKQVDGLSGFEATK
jgi:type VI protein secretion system component VasK